MVKDILDFLKKLAANNNREWFQLNKSKYEAAKTEVDVIVAELLKEISVFDSDIKFTTPKDCVFRIYKDVRFSHDKTPYKTNMGAIIRKGGRGGPNYAGYYLHFEPGGCFLAGGIWMPEAPLLKAIRSEILYNTDVYLKLINDKQFKKYFGEIDGEKLVNAPKDFPKDFEHIELLKLKSYNMMHFYDPSAMTQKELVKYVVKMFKLMKPYNDFLNHVVPEAL
ncbi:MAG: DUF2461 domain-containing protein [Bacteroidota bacterium]